MYGKLFLLSTAEAVLRHIFTRGRQPKRISIVYRWGGIETRTLLCHRICQHFYCLPLRRYWDLALDASALGYFLFLLSTAEAVLRHPTHGYLHLRSGFLLSTAEAVLRHTLGFRLCCDAVTHFHCLPLRRYWDSDLTNFWSLSWVIFLLSTAEAVLRLVHNDCAVRQFCISIVYRWGGIETYAEKRTLLPPPQISIVYRWGGIETRILPSFLHDVSCTFLLSTAEAVLRQLGDIPRHLSGVFLLSTAEAVLRPFHFFNLLIIRERYTWWQRKDLFQEQTMQAWLIRNKGRNSVIM